MTIFPMILLFLGFYRMFLIWIQSGLQNPEIQVVFALEVIWFSMSKYKFVQRFRKFMQTYFLELNVK